MDHANGSFPVRRFSRAAGHANASDYVYANCGRSCLCPRQLRDGGIVPDDRSAISIYLAAQRAGDLNVAIVGWNDATAQVTSVTDSNGNVLTAGRGPYGAYWLARSSYRNLFITLRKSRLPQPAPMP